MSLNAQYWKKLGHYYGATREYLQLFKATKFSKSQYLKFAILQSPSTTKIINEESFKGWLNIRKVKIGFSPNRNKIGL